MGHDSSHRRGDARVTVLRRLAAQQLDPLAGRPVHSTQTSRLFCIFRRFWGREAEEITMGILGVEIRNMANGYLDSYYVTNKNVFTPYDTIVRHGHVCYNIL